MTIVVYHPAKGALTTNETKVAGDRMPGENQRARSGHYFSCAHCGFCSQIFTGEDSRFRSVAAAHLHVCPHQHVRAEAHSDPTYHNGTVEPDTFLEGL